MRLMTEGLPHRKHLKTHKTKGKNILIMEEDVILAMQGGNGNGKVRGSSKAEDGNGVDKDNEERRWRSQPSPQTEAIVVQDVGLTHKAKGTSSPPPV